KGLGFRVVHLVPKGTAETVASYDGIAAQKELTSGRGAQSLARRSFLYPLSGAKSGDAVAEQPETAEATTAEQATPVAGRARVAARSAALGSSNRWQTRVLRRSVRTP